MTPISYNGLEETRKRLGLHVGDDAQDALRQLTRDIYKDAARRSNIELRKLAEAYLEMKGALYIARNSTSQDDWQRAHDLQTCFEELIGIIMDMTKDMEATDGMEG